MNCSLDSVFLQSKRLPHLSMCNHGDSLENLFVGFHMTSMNAAHTEVNSAVSGKLYEHPFLLAFLMASIYSWPPLSIFYETCWKNHSITCIEQEKKLVEIKPDLLYLFSVSPR